MGESGGGGGEGGGGGPGSLEELTKKGLQQFAPVLAIMLLAGSLLSAGRGEAQEVSFQWFKTNLLAKGAVERVEVANKSTVKVYVRGGAAGARRVGGAAGGNAAGEDGGAYGDESFTGGAAGGAAGTGGGGAVPGLGGGQAVYRYFFNIGSVDAFEHAMEEAQESLGVDHTR